MPEIKQAISAAMVKRLATDSAARLSDRDA
jgi:hypothetical protein